MTIFNYHPKTGEYIGKSEARRSPREEEVYLIPAYATQKPPPETGKHECSVFNGSLWEIVPDYRGLTYYNSWDDNGTTITELGVAPPEDSYTVRPEKPPLTYEEKVALVDMQRREAYKQRVDPLTNEYQVKILTGEKAEAEALIPLIISEREAIQTEYPWPVEGE
jgi:fibronectin type 3 domain-containing protein